NHGQDAEVSLRIVVVVSLAVELFQAGFRELLDLPGEVIYPILAQVHVDVLGIGQTGSTSQVRLDDVETFEVFITFQDQLLPIQHLGDPCRHPAFRQPPQAKGIRLDCPGVVSGRGMFAQRVPAASWRVSRPYRTGALGASTMPLPRRLPRLYSPGKNNLQ